jgi:hypothetical protein
VENYENVLGLAQIFHKYSKKNKNNYFIVHFLY